jgi:anti-sigma B factor antagonist
VTTEAFGQHGSYVRLAGEIDLAYAARLEEAIEGEISRGHRHLVIDLSQATILDCASIGTLLRGAAPLRREPDSAIVLAGATGIVKRLLDLLHIERLFDILPDPDSAAEHAIATDRQRVDGWRRTNRETLVDDRPDTDRQTSSSGLCSVQARKAPSAAHTPHAESGQCQTHAVLDDEGADQWPPHERQTSSAT